MKSIFLLLVFFSINAFSDVELISTSVTGEGNTKNAAIKAALVEALAQVNGQSVNSEMLLKSSVSSTINNNDEDYFSSSEYINAIRIKTNGAVDSYEIIDSHEQADGSWQVELQVAVANFKRRPSSKRKSIAIFPLRIDGGYRSPESEVSAAWISRMVSQEISSGLVQARKFTIVDRDFSQESNFELAKATGYTLAPSQLARLGQELVADYVLVGSIESFGLAKNAKVFVSEGSVFSKYIARVNFRLIDSATKQAVMSHSGDVNLSIAKILSGGVKSDFVTLAEKIGKSISLAILNQIYPIAIVSVNGTEVVLGQGGSLLKKGEQYKVYQYADKIQDSYTKEGLGRYEQYCCLVKVTRVLPKKSYGTLDVQGMISPDNVDKKLFILREKVLRRMVDSSLKDFDREETKNNSDW